MPSPIVQAPAGFVPEQAIAFGSEGGPAVPVNAANPLPTTFTLGTAVATPLAGSTNVSGAAGPFVPDLGRAIWLTLTGTWSGTVSVLRSVDGGTTRIPLTIAGSGWASYTANCNEAVGEETVAGATYYLDIALQSGTLAYRVQQ